MIRKECILIVDDESAIRVFLEEELTQAGYAVLTAASGEEALMVLEAKPVDLVLLDLKMAGMSGLQVMSKITQRPLPPEVIMLTAHATLDSAIETMRRGGHDYLIKPCRTDELLASIAKGLSRRREMLHQQEMLSLIEESARRLRGSIQPQETILPTQSRFLETRGLLLDLEQHTVTKQGHPLNLTFTEFRLLLCLMKRSGQIVPFDELMTEVHGIEGDVLEARQALTTHLWRLRKKVGNAHDGKPYIMNVRGQGYKFVS